MKTKNFWQGAFVSVVLSCALQAEAPMYDVAKEKVLYCVGYAHLDTQWRWDFPTTISQYIKDTLEQNFQRFEQFPEYRFNFTGSVRYEMMKEYYPREYEKLKGYIAQGRWFVSGSSVDEGDVNVPSPEAVIRQILYGNQYFRREFGKESVDFMLPDCFGFPASMPSIWAHCGLLGFSTQKLTWGSAVGIPFKVGQWEGPDGKSVIAAFDPGPYVGAIQGRVDTNSEWARRIEENGSKYGVWADYHYYGVGDQGGAPREADVRNYIGSMDNPDGLFRVALVASDQLFKDIGEDHKTRLPRYRGDLLLTEHSAGTLTSQSYMKRWNRKNENLADASERAAVAAFGLGGRPYPREALYRSWVRLLANQMHDILPGTSIPRAYRYSWNDELLAMNGFATVMEDSTETVTAALDTRFLGVPLIVYNPLAIEREDLVEAEVPIAAFSTPMIRVFGPQGSEVPSQLLERTDKSFRVLFVAQTPPVSWSVYEVRGADEPFSDETILQVSESLIENETYRVSLNEQGDVKSIVDKRDGGRELLAQPARLVFTYERPNQWPAWNMDWKDRQKPPLGALAGPARIRIVERGPVRVSLEIEREARNSVFVQRIRLARGDAGRRIEFETDVDWQSTECALKASFPLTVSNPKATYNWGLGTIDRGNNMPSQYEVPSHEWFDLTDRSGEYGVSILEDCKYGSDKPTDNEVRLTLLYTPGVRQSYLDQHSQDWGRHEFVYALYGHRGDWREGQSEWQGRRINQPLRVWQAPRGRQGDSRLFSLLSVNTSQVDVRAVKLAEESDKVVVRLQELWGRSADPVVVTFADQVVEIQEVDGQERPIGKAMAATGRLVTRLEKYSPRSFEVRLRTQTPNVPSIGSRPVELAFDTDVASRDGKFTDGAFGAEGRTLPGEMLPDRIISDGIEFRLGPTVNGQPNAITCRGQTVRLPKGQFDRVYLLAAAVEDVSGRFDTDISQELAIQSWTGFIGQWDDRIWNREFDEVDHRCEGQVTGIMAGFIKRAPVAWFATHRHDPIHGNQPYQFSYLFRYALDQSMGNELLRLPDEPRIKILAVTVSHGRGSLREGLRPAAPLYDDFTNRQPVRFRHVYPAPPVPVHKGLRALGIVVADRKSRFDELSMGMPSANDLADRSTQGGPSFRFVDKNEELRPHAGSGADGDSLPRLNDGRIAENDDDTQRCVWFDNEGRFLLDLRKSVPVSRINTYSWHRSNRAPQVFSVWGSDSSDVPDPLFRNGENAAWILLGVVNTKELGEGGIHASSIMLPSKEGALRSFRFLLWVAEDMGMGTFFTEIDVHGAE